MTLKTSGGGVIGRRPSSRKRYYSRVSRGIEITQSWPKPRGRSLAPKTREQMEFFRQVQWAFKYQDPFIAVQYAQTVQGTPLLPRDLFLMAAANRMSELHLPDGSRIFSMAQVVDMSKMLDALSYIPGSLLVRYDELWGAFPPGPEGWVMTSAGESEVPGWAPPTGGGSAKWVALPEVPILAPTNAVTVDVTGATDIMLLGRLLTTGVTATRGMQVSTDGGLSWLNVTGDYLNVTTTGAETATWICGHHGSPTTAARDCGGVIMALDAETGPRMVQSFSNTPALIRPLAAPITHVRCLAQVASGNAPTPLTGGTVYAWIR